MPNPADSMSVDGIMGLEPVTNISLMQVEGKKIKTVRFSDNLVTVHALPVDLDAETDIEDGEDDNDEESFSDAGQSATTPLKRRRSIAVEQELQIDVDNFVAAEESSLTEVVPLINSLIINTSHLLQVLKPHQLLKLIDAIAKGETNIEFYGLARVEKIYRELQDQGKTGFVHGTTEERKAQFGILRNASDPHDLILFLAAILNGEPLQGHKVVISYLAWNQFFNTPQIDQYLNKYRWIWCAVDNQALEIVLKYMINNTTSLDELAAKIHQASYIFCKLGNSEYVKGYLNTIESLEQAASSSVPKEFAAFEKRLTRMGDIRDQAKILYEQAQKLTPEKNAALAAQSFAPVCMGPSSCAVTMT